MKRPFLLLLLPTVLVAGGLYSCYYWKHRPGPPGIVGRPPDLISQLSPDAPVILFADLAALRASGFSAQLAAIVPAPAQDPEYKDFIRSTGFDYARDLDQMAAGIWLGPPVARVVAIANGRFDREKIRRYALRSGSISKHGGAEVYEFHAKNPPRKVFIAFLAPNRIAIADGTSMDAVLLPAPTRRPEPAVRDRITRVGGSAFFAAARTHGLPRDITFEGMHPGQLSRLWRGVQSVTLAGQPEGEHLRVAVDADCDSAADAFKLAVQLDALRWLGRAALADPKTRRNIEPQEQKLLDGLLQVAEISHESQRVRLRFVLTPEMFGPVPKVSLPPSPTQ